MNAKSDPNETVARIAAAIGDPTRARMLYCLLDNRARTGTELALVAKVNASTASAHLAKLKSEALVHIVAQGKHRFYSLNGDDVAAVLEKLSVLAGATRTPFIPTAPEQLRAARTCYDHVAGTLGVQLHERFKALSWIVRDAEGNDAYRVTEKGTSAFRAMGVDVTATQALRRRFAFACLDWSERRAHLGGAMGAAVLQALLRQKWIVQERDDRVLRVTARGAREMRRLLDITMA